MDEASELRVEGVLLGENTWIRQRARSVTSGVVGWASQLLESLRRRLDGWDWVLYSAHVGL